MFLLVAQRRSTRPPNDRHPLGYGREAYFWALIAACAAFVGGAAFSLRDGINELIHPSATSSFAAAYVVLAISAVFDLVSLRRSAGQMRYRARRYGRSLMEESRVTSDPALRHVFNEDAVSVSGDVIAFVALAVNQITGSSIPQGVAAVLIGLVLIRISLRLISRSHDFLVGVWVLTPAPKDRDADDLVEAIGPADAERLQAFLSAYPGVTGIREVLVNFLGPGRVWIVARVDIDDDLRGADVASLVRGIESGMRRESEHVYRVDIVPTAASTLPLRGSRLTGDPGVNRGGRKVLLRIAKLTFELPLATKESDSSGAGLPLRGRYGRGFGRLRMTSARLPVKICHMREHRFFRDEQFEFAMRLALGSAYHQAAEVGECLATAARIRERDFEGWCREWSRTAERVEGVARDCEARGHALSARGAYLRASTYFFTASVFVDATDQPQQLVPTWERHRACWDRAAALHDPPFEPVAIPYEETTLPGYWMCPDSTSRPRPLLLMNNGSDGPISDMYVFGGAGALARGYNVLAYDGPGQGAALYRQGLSLRPDWERVVTPVVDYALSRDDVDPGRIAIYGASMGGYMVARAAAFERRIAAAITDPGVWDVATPSDSPVSRFVRRSTQRGVRAPIDMIAAALAARGPRPLRHTLRFGVRPYGTRSLVEMLTLLGEYNLDGIAGRISCPLLVLDPEGEQFWPGEAQRLSDSAAGPTAIAHFSADEGGALHMQPLARGLSDQRILDWLDETFAGAGQAAARHAAAIGTPHS